MIKWNEYTWYSRLAAAIFFIIVLPIWTFYLGQKYQETRHLKESNTSQVFDVNTNLKHSTTTPDNYVLLDTYTPGCTDTPTIRLCNLLFISSQPLYSLLFTTKSQEIKVYSEGKYLQTISLPEKLFDLGFGAEGFMEAVDINFDGYKDLSLRTCQGATGNQCWDYFLFNSNNKHFEYSAEFSATDGQPSKNNKEIRSFYKLGCAGLCYVERIYKVENNKPMLIRETKQDLNHQNRVITKVVRQLEDSKFVTATSTESTGNL
jgi:hypothetical protein